MDPFNRAPPTSGGRLSYPDAGTERAITAIEARWREKLASAVSDIGLRKWCVEEALKASGGNGNIVDLARAIHTFITEAAQPQVE